MKKSKVVKSLLVTALVIVMIGTQSVYAYDVSSSLINSDQTVSSSYSGDMGVHQINVHGYEKHSNTNQIYEYSKDLSSLPGTGFSTKHNADSGYKFQKQYTYNGKALHLTTTFYDKENYVWVKRAEIRL